MPLICPLNAKIFITFIWNFHRIAQCEGGLRDKTGYLDRPNKNTPSPPLTDARPEDGRKQRLCFVPSITFV